MNLINMLGIDSAAVLVALAGVGYLADSVGPLVWSRDTIEVSVATFVGEVALMGWLLLSAARPLGSRPTGYHDDKAALGGPHGQVRKPDYTAA